MGQKLKYFPTYRICKFAYVQIEKKFNIVFTCNNNFFKTNVAITYKRVLVGKFSQNEYPYVDFFTDTQIEKISQPYRIIGDYLRML